MISVLFLDLKAYQQFGILKVQFAQVFSIGSLTDWSQLILRGEKMMLVFHIKFIAVLAIFNSYIEFNKQFELLILLKIKHVRFISSIQYILLNVTVIQFTIK